MRCDCGSMNGCGGRLCRSAVRSLRRMPLCRYSVSSGEVDTTSRPLVGWVCGIVSGEKRSTGGVGNLRIEGRIGSTVGRRLTVAACSFGDIRAGDRVAFGRMIYRVVSVENGEYLTARLLPDGEETT